MVGVCIVCGHRSKVEPHEDRNVTSLVCQGVCQAAYLAWTAKSDLDNPKTLRDYYLEALSGCDDLLGMRQKDTRPSSSPPS